MKIKDVIAFLSKCDPEKEVIGYEPMDYTPYRIKSLIKMKDLVAKEKEFMVDECESLTEDQYTNLMNEVEEEFLNFDGEDVVFSFEDAYSDKS